MTILAKNPAREEFAACSTSNNYYDTKGHAIHAFDAVLRDYGMKLEDENIVDLSGPEGRVHWMVCTDCELYPEGIGQAIISWYRMPSGRYEFVGYLA